MRPVRCFKTWTGCHDTMYPFPPPPCGRRGPDGSTAVSSSISTIAAASRPKSGRRSLAGLTASSSRTASPRALALPTRYNSQSSDDASPEAADRAGYVKWTTASNSSTWRPSL